MDPAGPVRRSFPFIPLRPSEDSRHRSVERRPFRRSLPGIPRLQLHLHGRGHHQGYRRKHQPRVWASGSSPGRRPGFGYTNDLCLRQDPEAALVGRGHRRFADDVQVVDLAGRSLPRTSYRPAKAPHRAPLEKKIALVQDAYAACQSPPGREKSQGRAPGPDPISS